jgi:ketosteroid isomerase-like protein
MKRVIVALVAFASLAQAEKAKPAAGAADAELKAACEKMGQAWANADEAAFTGALADEIWGSWDMDEAGRPATQATKADVVKEFQSMSKMMKMMGAKAEMKPTSTVCKTSGDLGVCFVEGEMTMTIPKMPPMTMSFRGTDVAKKEKGAWKWVHHHGSLAKWPMMPMKTMAMTAKNATWMDAPDRPGMKMSPIWMNPVTKQMTALMTVTKEIKQARHFHPYAAAFVVLEGQMITTGPDGKDTAYGPGSILYRAPKELHTTTLKPGTTVFAATDGPIVEIYVDDKGNPMPPTAQK